MTPSWPAVPPLTSCVTSTGRSTSLGFHHLPNKKAAPPPKRAGRTRTHLVRGDHWQGLGQGQHRMGKLRPVTPRPHLRTRPRPQLHVWFHLILAGVTSGFWSASHAPARGCLMRRAVGYFIFLFYRPRSTELNLQLQPAPSWSLRSTRFLHASRRQELKAL